MQHFTNNMPTTATPQADGVNDRAEALCRIRSDLDAWLQAYLETGTSGGVAVVPDIGPLLPHFKSLSRYRVVAEMFDDRSVKLILNKPDKTGKTDRVINVEFAFVALVHLACGATLRLTRNGQARNTFYLRVRAGKLAEDHALRLIAGTGHRWLTVEPNDYHDLRRSKMGQRKPDNTSQQRAKRTYKDAIEASVQLCETKKRYKGILNPAETRRLLTEGYRILHAVPLGAIATEAE